MIFLVDFPLQPLDVEEFETRADRLRDGVLSFAPRLFVEDGAVGGGSRASELRLRVVTDSSVVALYFRSLLHRTPLYSPEVFPRTLTVYVATLGGAAAGSPFAAIDIDAGAASGTVLASGAVPLSSLRDAMGVAAGHLQALGGYRSVRGGGAQSPNLAEARADGVLDWYARDGHVYAQPSEPHPDLLTLGGGSVAVSGSGGVALVLGARAGALVGAAATAGRLVGAHHVVWGPRTLTPLWAGVSLPAAPAAPLPGVCGERGALFTQSSVTAPLLCGPGASVAPSSLFIIEASAPTSGAPVTGAPEAVVARVATAAGGLTAKQTAKLAARLAGGSVGVTAVPTEAAAAALLGLALQ